MRSILHVDMDAFYASVEVRDKPELRGKPVLVGGRGRRGVVAAASYEARKFGCRSAQPMSMALRSCPHAIVMPPRFQAYEAASKAVFAVFDRFTPMVEPLSIDEAFLDITGTERVFGPAREVAESIREEVFERTQLTCSVGASAVKFIAKIASAHQKPNGLTVVEPGSELEFLGPLPIRKLWGVGPKTAERLEAWGIETIGDLRDLERKELVRRFGKHGGHLSDLSHAIDVRRVQPGQERKQISHEDTYGTDLVGETAVRERLLAQSSRVADRLVHKDVKARKVHLKIRDTDFVTESRQLTLERPSRDAAVLYRSVCRLLADIQIEGRRFRLTGVGASDLSKPTQLDLFTTEPEARGDDLQEVVSEVRARFGASSLSRGTLPADHDPHSAALARSAPELDGREHTGEERPEGDIENDEDIP